MTCCLVVLAFLVALAAPHGVAVRKLMAPPLGSLPALPPVTLANLTSEFKVTHRCLVPRCLVVHCACPRPL